MKKNLKKEILKQVQYDKEWKSRHSEFSSESDKILNQVQYDDNKGCHPEQFAARHPEFISGSKEIRSQVQNDSFQFGRSMIEMLGVLAIIGVLSIGGLTAYRQAIIRHQNNALINGIGHARMAIQDICGENNTNICPLFWNAETQSGKSKSEVMTHLCPQIAGCTFASSVKETAYFENAPFKWYVYTLFDTHPRLIYRFVFENLSSQACLHALHTNWSDLYGLHVLDGDRYVASTTPFTDEKMQAFENACLSKDFKGRIIVSFYLQ